jgi:L-iditol 2-dehydrogenase
VKSLRCEGNGRVVLVDVPDPEPASGEALVRIEASAVCGSERGTLMEGYPGNSGHEACGRVVEPGASGFRKHDLVGLAAVVGCAECDRCRAGQELHCRRGWQPSSRLGWHAELAAVRASALRELPDGFDPGMGAMLSGDSLGVPMRSLRRAPAAPGESVLVIGLGPVGLGHVLVRSFLGAEVVGIDPSAYRRDLARRLGARTVLAPGEEIPGHHSLVIECSGRPDCITQALQLVDNGGIVLQSGECHVDVQIKPSETLIRREVTYTGSWYYASEDYPAMLDVMARGLPLGRLCTHEVPAADAQAAISDFLEARTGKVVLRWS